MDGGEADLAGGGVRPSAPGVALSGTRGDARRGGVAALGGGGSAPRRAHGAVRRGRRGVVGRGGRGIARLAGSGGVRRDERGAVTAELALVLPAVVLVLLVCLTLAAAVLGQVRCADAARAAARAAAIGEPAAVVIAVARDLAGPDAEISVDDDGDWVEVVVSRPVASGVPGVADLRARAAARAWVEPGAGP